MKQVLIIKKTGFTLIELLVVISILGLLAGLVLSNVSGIRERARDVARKSDLDQIKKALRMYYNDNNGYPTTANFPPTVGTSFSSGTVVYMKSVPGDPGTGSGYSYYRTNCTTGTNDFRLVAVLENKSDLSLAQSHIKCSDDCGFVYDTTAKNQYVACAD